MLFELKNNPPIEGKIIAKTVNIILVKSNDKYFIVSRSELKNDVDDK